MTKLSKVSLKMSFLAVKVLTLTAIPFTLISLPINRFDDHSFTLCLFTLLTGEECYGCGMTRAFMHLIHFDVIGAYNFNKLSIITFPIISYLYIVEYLKTLKQFKYQLSISFFIVFFTMLISVPSQAVAQPEDFKYIGLIRIKNSTSFSYQLEFNINGQTISGRSITNAGNKYETTASISGKIDLAKNNLSFTEQKILSTSVKGESVPFCFVSSVLRLKRRAGFDLYEGDFVGKDEEGKVCATGTIYLTRKNAIMADSVNVGNFINEIRDTIQERKAEILATPTLTNTAINKIICVNSAVNIKFYDSGRLDNDQIAINYNGETIVKKIVLTKMGYNHIFRISPGKDNIITIKTLNTGYYEPNSVTLDVTTAPGVTKVFNLYAESNTTIKIQLSVTE